MVSAICRASVHSVTVVIPYFGYSRQDSRARKGRGTFVPIPSKDIATMLETVGVDNVITMDLHNQEIQGYFGCGVTNLTGSPIGAKYFAEKADLSGAVVVSPDANGKS